MQCQNRPLGTGALWSQPTDFTMTNTESMIYTWPNYPSPDLNYSDPITKSLVPHFRAHFLAKVSAYLSEMGFRTRIQGTKGQWSGELYCGLPRYVFVLVNQCSRFLISDLMTEIIEPRVAFIHIQTFTTFTTRNSYISYYVWF